MTKAEALEKLNTELKLFREMAQVLEQTDALLLHFAPEKVDDNLADWYATKILTLEEAKQKVLNS